MTRVTVLEPTNPPEPIFQRKFARPVDALDYVNYWSKVGNCLLQVEEIPNDT